MRKSRRSPTVFHASFRATRSATPTIRRWTSSTKDQGVDADRCECHLDEINEISLFKLNNFFDHKISLNFINNETILAKNSFKKFYKEYTPVFCGKRSSAPQPWDFARCTHSWKRRLCILRVSLRRRQKDARKWLLYESAPYSCASLLRSYLRVRQYDEPFPTPSTLSPPKKLCIYYTLNYKIQTIKFHLILFLKLRFFRMKSPPSVSPKSWNRRRRYRGRVQTRTITNNFARGGKERL